MDANCSWVGIQYRLFSSGMSAILFPFGAITDIQLFFNTNEYPARSITDMDTRVNAIPGQWSTLHKIIHVVSPPFGSATSTSPRPIAWK